MISLFIDTASTKLILLVFKDKEQISFDCIDSNNDLSGKVLDYLDKNLKNINLKISDIDQIYVVNGPGSFTGIRVGITIAKTIAYSLNKPIYTISELQLLATTETDKKYIVPLIDARRGYVYAGIYDKKLKNIVKDQYILYNDLTEQIKKDYSVDDVCFVSYDSFEDSIEPKVNIEKIIKTKYKPVNPHKVNPNYLKNTEAEEKLNDKKN